MRIWNLIRFLRRSGQLPNPLGPISDGLEIAGRMAVLTTRDLNLIYKGTQRFHDFVPEEKKKAFGRQLTGIMAHKTITDTGFLQLRIMALETTASEIVMKSTQPDDDLVDLLTFVDLRSLYYSTPAELHHQILTMYS